MNTSGSIRARAARRLPACVAALACTVGALAVVQLSGSNAADATTPAACAPVDQPLGSATGWNEFVEGNGTRTSESEGSVAYGGSLNAGGASMTVGGSLPGTTPAATPTLVVGGAHGQFNLQVGSAWMSPKSNVNFNGSGGSPRWLASNPIDFAASFTDLRAKSAAWGAATANGTVTAGVVSGSQPAWVLTGTDAQLNVFTMTAAQLAQNKRIVYDFPAGSAVLINVLDAGSVSITGNDLWVMVGGNAQQTADGNKAAFKGVLWNLPNATGLTLATGGAFGGSVLAPHAAVTVAGPAHTIGQMIAKSFSSGVETHPNDWLDKPCLPTTTPSTPGTPDVKITKTASVANPHGGDLVTYTLVVENIGTTTASGVVATDALPTGVTFDSASTGCSFSGGTVTCTVGTLAAGASTSFTIRVVAVPVAGAGPTSHPQAHHWLTPYKVEQHVDLDPGQIKSVTVSCNPGGILSDGQLRLDHVDQGTGHIKDLRILSSRSTGLGSWEAVVANPATGRAQAKAFIVCLPELTEPADRQTGYGDSHQHPLLADPALVTATNAYAVGRQTTTLTCPTGTVPIAPGFALSGGAATLAASEYDDQAAPRSWTFTLDVTAPTTATLSARCLRTTVGPVRGHTHELLLTHVVRTVTVNATTAQEGDEFKVSCPDDAKGVVSTWKVPSGVLHFGNDPRLKERAFRLFNSTGSAQQATVDLLCLRDRTSTEQMGTQDPVVVQNTAVVTSTSADANGANNSSAATITVQPGSATTGLGGSGQVSGSSFAVRVASSMPGRGRLTVRAGGRLLAQGTVALRPGRAATARLALTRAGRAELAGLERVTVRVDPARGRATSRTVQVVG